MSTDLPIELDGWGPVSESLAELRAGREDSVRFFMQWFDQVESLLSELLHERGRWQDECAPTKGEDAPWTAFFDQLAQVHGEMAETRNEIQRLVEPLETVMQEVPDRQINERLQDELDTLRKEYETIQAERLLLESELENVRRRAAQLAETLDQQQRAKGEQESYWREEFRRQCVLVERLTGKLVQSPPVNPSPPVENISDSSQNLATPMAANAPRDENENNLEVEDLALESVKAQFELLQEEATRRRQEKSGIS